ncbi:MAG: RagB/SusD family nutrient uptake outer membrane protein [Bacteroidota bacterium]
MKRFIIYFRVLLTASLLYSCTDQLDEPLQNEPIGLEFDEGGQLAIALSAYQDLYNLGWEIHPTIAMRGDDVNKGGGTDQPQMGLHDEFVYDPGYWFYNNTWNGFYSDILTGFYVAIEEIEKVNDVVEDPTLGNQYIAEVKVMIGFELLHIVRLWGDILIPESSDSEEFAELPVTSREDALRYISDLMDEAIPQLPNMRPNQREDILGGVTQHTALAVKAMANLDLENYQEAANATSEIIESGLFTLYDDYYNLFKKPGELSDEILFELQYSDFGSPSTATGDFNHLFNFYGPLGVGWDPAVEGASAGWGFWEPTFKYIEFMLNREDNTRLETSVLFTPAGVEELNNRGFTDLPSFTNASGDFIYTRDGDGIGNHARALFHSGKHYLPTTQISTGVTRFNSGKNFILIRYSEVLLMHAEAIVSGGTSSSISAEAAVNLVRERADLDPVASVDLDAVLDEKYAELGMEWGIRFADVVRHGRTNELNENGKVYNPAEDRFIPYPTAQVDQLPQLNN